MQMNIIRDIEISKNLKKDFRAVDNTVVDYHTAVYEQMRTFVEEFPTDNNLFLFTNPYQTSPLSIVIGVRTSFLSKISVVVHGKNGDGGNITHSYDDGSYHSLHIVALLGLYPNYNNNITVQLETEDQNVISTDFQAQTDPLPDNFPIIEVIETAQTARLNNDLYYCPMSNSYLYAVDYEGEVRWLINETNPNFPQHLDGGSTLWLLENGHLLANYINHYALVELSQEGRIHRVYNLNTYIHHDLIQDTDSNFLIQSQDDNTNYVFDTLLKVDSITEEVLKNIDFKDIFDPNERVIQPTEEHNGSLAYDWLHANSIDYHTASNVYITSSRHQNAVIATDQDTNEVKWILGSHYDWSERFQACLLTPVDSEGNVLYDFSNDEDIIRADHEFWQWAQHSARIFTNNEDEHIVELFVFDNGCFRSYDENNWIYPNVNYSRVLLYEINTSNMTVQLIWNFGQELGSSYYCGYVSNVQYIKETNTIYINYGGIIIDMETGYSLGVPGQDAKVPGVDYDALSTQHYTHIVEVDFATKEVLYDCQMYIPNNVGGEQMTPIYKGLKADLYTSN